LRASALSGRRYPPDSANYSYEDWFYILNSNPDISSQSGKEVILIGFVFENESFESHVFVLARFMKFHCAIDARTVGFPV